MPWRSSAACSRSGNRGGSRGRRKTSALHPAPQSVRQNAHLTRSSGSARTSRSAYPPQPAAARQNTLRTRTTTPRTGHHVASSSMLLDKLTVEHVQPTLLGGQPSDLELAGTDHVQDGGTDGRR